MRAIEIAPDIYWVGAIDWDLRDFHGYGTPHGTTYNAYLVRGEAGLALIDTVKDPFVDEMLARIRDVADPAEITHVVVNHLEPDHNGGLRSALEAIPNARVVASPGGSRALPDYHAGLAADPVKDDVIDLGGLTLRFMPMPMVHWPDSMFTWCEERAVLMPNDAFGQHRASEERFADELGLDVALQEAHTYFANILMPLTTQVGKAIAKVVEAGWAPKTIAPSHGVGWRGEDIPRILEAYGRWCAGETDASVVVAFTTMWESTRMLAHAVADGVGEAGAEAHLFDLATSPTAEITDRLLDARVLALGSPALHDGMLFRVAGYLQYLKGLHPAGKRAAVFGSYGWSGGAIEEMTERLELIGFAMPFEPFKVKFRPTPDDLEAARAWGRQIGESAL